MKLKRILVWFRNDLRLHDNEMLVEAIAKSDYILPVYFFDPRDFDPDQVSRSGEIRTKFLIESVSELRGAFQKLNGNLLIVRGLPEDHIPSLVAQYDIAEVYHHREVAPAETSVSAEVEDQLWKLKINLRHFIGHTLYNKEDLPFPIKDIPDVFTQFKKKTERDAIVKPCIDTPDHIDFVESEEWGDLPLLTDFFPADEKSAGLVGHGITGGEEAGLNHLAALLAEHSAIYAKPSAKDRSVRNSNLSAWLSLGCLSPRKVYWAIKKAEERFGSNPNFNHLILGLLWRDYFRFMFKKHGASFLEASLLKTELAASRDENAFFEAWKTGQTGHTLINKLMKELNHTGFLPYSARILVATFLVHVLKVNWMKGAAYFEERLIDYTTSSNWGNWASIAEGGKAAKSKHAFDIDKQLQLLKSTSLV
jgi:deoxyribodipyrimidine photo-lyase